MKDGQANSRLLYNTPPGAEPSASQQRLHNAVAKRNVWTPGTFAANTGTYQRRLWQPQEQGESISWFQLGSDQFVADGGNGVPLGFLCKLCGSNGLVADPILNLLVGGNALSVYGCFGNPGVFDPTLLARYQPATGMPISTPDQVYQPGNAYGYPSGFPKTDPSFSVILLDATGQQLAAFGDWVQATNTGVTAQFTLAGASSPSTFQVWEVVGRQADKTIYQGTLVDDISQNNPPTYTSKCDILFPGAPTNVQYQRVLCGTYLLDVGQPVYAGSTMAVQYDNDKRTWRFIGVICYANPGS